MALLVTLWLVALIAIFALAVVTITYRDAASARAELLDAQQRSVAESALAITIARLLDLNSQGRPAIDGHFRALEVFGSEVQIRITDDGGKIDLNRSDDSILEAYFTARFGTRVDGWQLLQQLRDWQDPDDSPRPGGAERLEYVLANRMPLPRNAPMESVDEMLLLLSAPPEIVCALDDFTVSSPTGFPSRNLASPHVAAAIDAAYGAQAADSRSVDPWDSLANMAPLGRTLTIDVDISTLSASKRWRLRVTGRLTGDSSQPYAIVARRAGYLTSITECDVHMQ